jgi:leishmanolysin-like peptidase
VQAYGSRRQDFQGVQDFQPLRVTFDFEKLDQNGKEASQRQYVKDVLSKAGRWLNKALRVRPVQGALKFTRTGYGLDCGDEVPTVPEQYVTTGVFNTDVLIFVLSDDVGQSDCTSGTLAYATHCQLDQNDRPVFGYIQMCAVHFHPLVSARGDKKTESDLDEDFHTALHEIIHILGFSEGLFPFFRDHSNKPLTPRCPTKYETIPASFDGERFQWYLGENRGQVGWCCAPNTLGQPPFRCEETGIRFVSKDVQRSVDLPQQSDLNLVGGKRTVLSTPNLLALARQHFDCPSLDGVELEDDGGKGTAGSHWERRVLLNEYMTGAPIGLKNAKSAFTLALLQDSGWYQANFQAADLLAWGAKVSKVVR